MTADFIVFLIGWIGGAMPGFIAGIAAMLIYLAHREGAR